MQKQRNICIRNKKLTSLVVLAVFFWFTRPYKFEYCMMVSFHGLKNSKFKMACKMVETNKKAAYQSCIYICTVHNVLCFKCSFYVFNNKQETS